jgi:hypothetical protein
MRDIGSFSYRNAFLLERDGQAVACLIGYPLPDEPEAIDYNIDAPGPTFANLRSLGQAICARPMYPLDEGVTFEPRPAILRRAQCKRYNIV